MSEPTLSSTENLSSFAGARLEALGFAEPAGQTGVALPQRLARVQVDLGLAASGELDAETWAALLSAGVPDGTWAAPQGEAWAGEAAARLAALGLRTAGPEDPLEPVVRAFQDKVLLEPTGRLDEETLWALRCATADLASLIEGAPEWMLDGGGSPLFFGQESREVQGRGGYTYRQYDDGGVMILSSPASAATGRLLRRGPAWAAITAEIGPYPAGPLALGSRGDAVQALQRRLVELGFGPLDDDGVFGDATATALRRFQGACGLEATGAVGPATKARLELPWPTLKVGDRGAEVRRCQQRLKALGAPITGIDGDFGPETETATRSFQTAVGLPSTGVIDAITHGHLLGLDAVNAPAPALEAERARLLGLAEPGLGALPEASRARVRGVVVEALRWFGLREIPRGSNGGPQVGALTAGVVGSGQPLPPWCALAVSHWLRVGLGAATWAETPLGFRNAAALAFGRWGEQRQCLLPSDGAAPTGSIFVMYRHGSGSDDGGARASSAARWEGLGHTGLVLQDLGDSVLTLDGNISDMCWTARRSKRDLIGFVAWWAPR